MVDFSKNILVDYAKFAESMDKMSSALPSLFNPRVAASQKWNPYTFEGGSTAAIAGKDFIVAASDSRMSQYDVNILSRCAEKTFLLNDNILLNTAGFQGDILQLKRVLEYRLHKYRFDYNRSMTADICAEMLSRILYSKRFFPFYTGVVLCGIDERGVGGIYGYDPIGTIERAQYECTGSAFSLMQPFLDAQFEKEGKQPVGCATGIDLVDVSVEEAVDMIKDAFNYATEREISTGDSLNMIILQAGKKPERLTSALRKD